MPSCFEDEFVVLQQDYSTTGQRFIARSKKDGHRVASILVFPEPRHVHLQQIASHTEGPTGARRTSIPMTKVLD